LWHELFQESFGQEQAGIFEFLSRLLVNFGEFDVGWRNSAVVAKDRVVPAFNRQIGIIAGAEEGMDNLGPVRLPKTGEAMLGHARMTKTIHVKQLTVDEGVLGVYVKNPRAELVDVGDG